MDNKKKKPNNKRLNKLFNGIQYEEPDTEPKKSDDKVIGQGQVDFAESNAQVPETESGESEAQASDESAQGDENEDNILTDSPNESSTENPEVEKDVSPEDLLDEVRHSLIEVQEAEDEKPKWWQRFGRGSRKGNKLAEAPAPLETMMEPDEPEPVGVPVTSPDLSAAKQDDGQDEYVEQLDELIDMLADETQEDVGVEDALAVYVEGSIPEEGQQAQEVVDLAELKKRAFSARTTPEEEERSLREVRSVALDEGEEVFVEVEAKVEDPMQDRMKAMENALKPYRRYFYFVFVFVSVVMVLLVSASLYPSMRQVYQQFQPPTPTQDVALLPYPVGMNLPGGLNFHLKKGKLQEGRWDPRGPEWLEGTEVCRWVAIPYSRQLEAVVRTLTQEDQIELIMSNNDILVYTVSSRDRLTLEEMQQLDSGSPCMLLVLAQADTDERWVVTAFP